MPLIEKPRREVKFMHLGWQSPLNLYMRFLRPECAEYIQPATDVKYYFRVRRCRHEAKGQKVPYLLSSKKQEI